MKSVCKIFIVLAFAFNSTGLFAQFSAAGGVSFGTAVEKLGLFARGAYDITDEIRGNATVNFFFGESVEGIASTNVWTINLDGHYKLIDEDEFGVYALAGLNLATVRVKFEDPTGIFGNFSESSTEVGLNVGGGAELPLDTVIPFAEVKYVISNLDQLVIMAGVRFPF